MIRSQVLVNPEAAKATHSLLHNNARTRMAFQAHFQRAFCRAAAVREEAQPDSGATAAQDGEVKTPPKKPSKLWVPYELAHAHLKPNATKASVVTLPLPLYFMNDVSRSCMQPRTFVSLDDVADVTQLQGLATGDLSKILPRDGELGLFFAREEIVDTMQLASHEYGFKSRVWINAQSPKVTSGFLKLKPGMQPLTLCCTTIVFDTACVDWAKAKNHPKCATLIRKRQEASVAGLTGCNLLSGKRCLNSEFNAAFGERNWITLEQVQRLGIPMENKGGNGTEADAFEDNGVLVEVDQFNMYNQDQLLVPGKIALDMAKSRAGKDGAPASEGLFQL